MSEEMATAIVCVSAITALATLVWMSIRIHRGDGFFKEIETSSGTLRRRLDIKLISYVILVAFGFGGLYVSFIGNYLWFIITKEWIFDPTITRGSLFAVLIVFSAYVVDYVYNYTLDKAERKIRIREVEGKKKE